MKHITRDLIRSYAADAQALIVTSRKAMLIWWDVDDRHFLVLPANSKAGRLLTERLDDAHVCCYVGLFDPSTTRAAIVEAMEAHAAGKLRGAA